MKALLSLLMKLLLLFYQIRYSRENNRYSFGFWKCKTTNGTHSVMTVQSVSDGRFIAGLNGVTTI